MQTIKKLVASGMILSTVLSMAVVAAPVKAATAVAGDLIKMSGLSSVYYLGADNKRYVFPNEATYKSWYADFSTVKTIPQAELESLMLGANVTVRPGTKLVKITTNPKVYAVEPGGSLVAIPDEATAKALYGDMWAKRVVDVADSFFTNYKISTKIATSAAFPAGSLVKFSASSADVFYVNEEGKAQKIASESAFIANRFAWENVLSGASMPMPSLGTEITGAVATDLTTGATGVVGQGTGATVALSGATPASASIPAGSTGVEYLKFNVTAANDGDATIKSVVVKRIGVGASSDFKGIYLYDGATRLTSSRSIASDSGEATFTVNVVVTKGTTKTLSVVADQEVAPTAKGNSNGFAIESASKITLAAGVVSGSFPVAGNLMSLNTNVAASTVTAAETSASWSTTIGTTQAEVAKLSVQAGVNDVTVNAITLRQGGSLANTNLANLKLKSGSTEVASVASMTGDKAVLAFNSGLVVAKGQTKNFVLTADIKGGRSNETVKFYIDELSDVSVKDNLYLVGAQVTNNFALGDQTVTMIGGQITLASNGPAATSYSANSTNKELFKVSATSEKNVTVKKTILQIVTGGTFVAGDLAKVKNIKLVDLDTNTTLVGPIADLSGFTSAGAAPAYTLSKTSSDTFDLVAGKTRKLAIQADFDNTVTNGITLKATLDLSTASGVYDNDSAEYVVVSNIVPSALTGNLITVTTSSLTAVKAAVPASATVVKGVQGVEAFGVNLTAGISDAVKVNKITARVYADADATFAPTTGDTAANTVVETVSLYDGATLVKGPVNLVLVDSNSNGSWDSAEYYKADFTSLGYSLTAGQMKKLTVKANMRNSFSGTKRVAIDLVPSTDIEAENAQGNLLTITGTALNLLASPSPVITVEQNGTLTVAIDGNTPNADVVVTGSSNVTFTKVRLSAAKEAFVVTGLKLVDLANNDVNLTAVKLSYVNTSGTTTTVTGNLSAGSLTLNDGQLDIYVPKDSTAILTISADLNTIAGGAVSGTAIKLGLAKSATQFGASANLTDEFIAMGASSNQKIYGNTNSVTLLDSSISAQTVYKTKISAVNGKTNTSGTGSTKEVVGMYRFTSAPEVGNTQNSTLNSITVELTGNLIATGGDNAVTIDVYSDSVDTANLMGTVSATTLAGSVAPVAITLNAKNEFTGTKDVYVVVNATDANFVDTSAATERLSSAITTYGWNDGVGAATPVAGLPVSGATLSY